MTDMTPLYNLNPGDTFLFGGADYVVVEHARSRTKITRLSDNKMFVLNMSAAVTPTGKSLDALGAALSNAPAVEKPTLTVGTRVLFVTNAKTRKLGLAGEEAVIVKVNAKTYGLSNGYRVGPSFVTAIPE